MKRKLMSLLLAGSLALTLAACGGKEPSPQGSSPENTPSAPASAVPDTTPQPAEPDPPAPSGDLPDSVNLEVRSASDYGDGMAFIELYDRPDKCYYFGLMDKSGIVQYCYDVGDDPYVESTTFHDGVGYLRCKSMLYELNTDGTVRRTFPYLKESSDAESGIEYAVAYGDGYVVTVVMESGFEGTSSSYFVYDPQNNKTELFSNGIYFDEVRYLGFGAFQFDVYLPYANGFDFDPETMFDQWRNIYCAKTGQWLADVGNYGEESLSSYTRVWLFDDCLICSSVSIDAVTPSSHDKSFVIIDQEGILRELKFSTQPSIVLDADDGLVAFQCGNTFYLGDFAAGTVTPYTGEYADSVVPLSADAHFRCIKNGRIGVPLGGKDGMAYVVFLDRDMKELCEPVQMSHWITCTDDYILNRINNQYNVLDANNSFNPIFSLEAVHYYVDAGDELLYSYQQGEYLQYDGTPLFQEIDYSQAKLIELPQ